MKERSKKTWIEISRRALHRNVRAFRKRVGKETHVMTIVKANAYGHGALLVAREAIHAGAMWVGVDSVDEALGLRAAGISEPVLVLGFTRSSRLRECVENGISFVVYNMETVRALRTLPILKSDKRTKKNTAFVHLKIETGTTRQGVDGEQLTKLVEALRVTPGVVMEGISTHYANVEDATDGVYARQQLGRFQQAIQQISASGIEIPWRHTACSAAAFMYPEMRLNLARMGIAQYGLWSSEETRLTMAKQDPSFQLHPVLTWKTIVAQVKRAGYGTPVSYGLSERVKRDSVLAVIPVGYWDGLDRGLSGIGHVLIRGRRCKIIGRICMNMCMVDVTDAHGVRPEDEVVLIGSQGSERISAEDVAAKLQTIQYEVVTRINPMLPRVLVP